MKIILAVILSSLIFIPAIKAQEGSDLKDLAIQQIAYYAKNLYERKNYREAQRAFARILRLDPQNEEALAFSKDLAAKVVDDVSYEDNEPSMPNFKTSSNAPEGGIEQEIILENQAIAQLKKEIIQMQAGVF